MHDSSGAQERLLGENVASFRPKLQGLQDGPRPVPQVHEASAGWVWLSLSPLAVVVEAPLSHPCF